jgi:hypothetical protein
MRRVFLLLLLVKSEGATIDRFSDVLDKGQIFLKTETDCPK